MDGIQVVFLLIDGWKWALNGIDIYRECLVEWLV